MSGQQQEPAGQEKPAVSRRPPKRLIIVLGAVIGLGAVGALIYHLHSRGYESTDDAFIHGHVTRVSPRVAGHVAKVRVTDNQWVEAGDVLVELDPRDYQVGLDQAEAQLEVARAQQEASRISVELTKATAYSRLQEAQAGVDVAGSAVQSAEAGVEVTKIQIEQARLDVTVAQAVAEQAKADVAVADAKAASDEVDLERYKQLQKSNVTTRQQLDHSRAAAEASNATVEAARKKASAVQVQASRSQTEVTSAQENLDAAQAHQAEARSNLEKAKAQLVSAQTAPQQVALSGAQFKVSSAQVDRAGSAVEQAQLQLSYTKVVAPVAGWVTNKAVEPGDFVMAGQPLMALVQKDMWVVANFRETQLARLRPGQPVDIRVDAYPDEVFRGHVDSIQAGTGAAFSLLPPENATGYFVKVVQRVPVKIVPDDPAELNRYHVGPGMSVVPTVNLRAGLPEAPAGADATPPRRGQEAAQ